MRPPALHVGLVGALPGIGHEPPQYPATGASEPEARTLAADTDAVHAVVPVTAKDEWQAMFSGPLDRKIECLCRMLVKARRFLADFRLEEGIVFLRTQQRPLDERQLLVQERFVARRGHVLMRCMGKPYDVVRDPRADTGAVAGQPPMLDVALRKLPRGGIDDLPTRQRRLVRQ